MENSVLECLGEGIFNLDQFIGDEGNCRDQEEEYVFDLNVCEEWFERFVFEDFVVDCEINGIYYYEEDCYGVYSWIVEEFYVFVVGVYIICVKICYGVCECIKEVYFVDVVQVDINKCQDEVYFKYDFGCVYQVWKDFFVFCFRFFRIVVFWDSFVGCLLW